MVETFPIREWGPSSSSSSGVGHFKDFRNKAKSFRNIPRGIGGIAPEIKPKMNHI